MNYYPRGSEWRKWDLHVHLPGTKLADGYTVGTDETPWEVFCEIIENSDVKVFGLTDYFSITGYYEFVDKFAIKYPNSKKRFFPNIELRLNESVNEVLEEINIHLIFRNNIPKEKMEEFMKNLKTETTDAQDRHLSCSELTLETQYEAAVVTRENIIKAFHETFGKKANRQDYMLIVTAANNDGIRPLRGQKRKENITDEIDKLSDAYFGGSQNTAHFLTTDRLEDKSQTIRPKPVFSGCDAHSFQQLSDWLGRVVSNESTSKEITWIKADPTFEGLHQTLIEPKERVAILPTKPDEKEPYKTIKRITFTGSSDFPTDSIELNTNLCSIIGSRSSGKSALLAYIAHAIQPEDTLSRQRDAQSENIREDEIGPAAGISWGDASSIVCEVEWGSGKKEGGKVIYIPQNYLYSISNRPLEVTSKIEPVLFMQFPTIKSQYEKTVVNIESCSELILTHTNQWFDAREGQEVNIAELRDLGDKTSIQEARDEYQKQIDVLKGSLSITDEDLKAYQQFTHLIAEKKARQSEIVLESQSVVPFLRKVDDAIVAIDINTSFSFSPSIDNLPLKLSTSIEEKLLDFKGEIDAEVKKKIIDYHTALMNEHKAIEEAVIKIKDDNKELIERNNQNTQLIKLVEAVNKQNTKIKEIEAKETQIKIKTDHLANQVGIIKANIEARIATLQELINAFKDLDQSQGKIIFGVEGLFDDDTKLLLAEKFNRQYNSVYIDNQQFIDIMKIRDEVSTFLESIYTESQKLKTGLQKRQAALDILSSAEEIRFTAIMEGDKIGGFERSTMTPGKRALFALTLMLNETDGAWPLLIDQPEDDLDSRSIYKQIVPYIIERKKERQIIMVSHNANLVIGADSEQIIVANKHADNQKNKDNCMFGYLTGALESSKPKTEADFTLDTCGIREHACEILDGGEEAFEKRKYKYRI